MEKPHSRPQIVEPHGRPFGSVEVHFLGALLKIVRVAFEFQGCATAHGQSAAKEGLQGDHHLLPAERSSRAPVDLAGRLFQPSGRNVLAAERCGIAPFAEPCGIHQKALGQYTLEVV
jgi:hypothetical protein